MSFVGPLFDQWYTLPIAVLYATSCYIGLYYNETQLFLLLNQICVRFSGILAWLQAHMA